MTKQPVFRFAPSPNGRLHLGHAYSALLNAELARRTGGRFLIRMEDIDTTRCTAELAKACLEDLAWLGLKWEEPVRVQSQHLQDYAAALEKLKTQNLVYPCYCSRSEVAAASDALDPDGAPVYPGTCRGVAVKNAPHSWRIDMRRALKIAGFSLEYKRFAADTLAVEIVKAQPERWGDAILARKDIHTSYHLAVVVDDALQSVTHIVRGADLEAATDLHVLLQKLLHLPTPLYHHHALLMEKAGEKLAKSRGSETLHTLRERGISPAELHKMAGV